MHSDTYTTIEKLSEVSRRIKPENVNDIKIGVENIEQHCDWQKIFGSLYNNQDGNRLG